MSRFHQFRGSLIQILKHNKDGAFRTKADREKSLKLSIETLYKEGGYQLEHVKYIKQRHIKYLTEKWLSEGLSSGSMKNRMSHLRWLMAKLNKPNLVPSNDELNIPKRIYVSNQDKSRDLTEDDLAKVPDDYMQMSLKAQKLFGLRVEGSLKIKPFIADQGDKLFIKGSWEKGRKDRYIPIITEEQRQWIKDCKSLVKFKSNSLIPSDTSFKTYYERFTKRCARNGINHRHGIRHLYAQKRYQEIAGMPCRVKGGLLWKDMTWEQRILDKKARLQVSKELGHERIAGITSIYLGSNRK